MTTKYGSDMAICLEDLKLQTQFAQKVINYLLDSIIQENDVYNREELAYGIQCVAEHLQNETEKYYQRYMNEANS